jgi:hypothetical protein
MSHLSFRPEGPAGKSRVREGAGCDPPPLDRGPKDRHVGPTCRPFGAPDGLVPRLVHALTDVAITYRLFEAVCFRRPSLEPH